MVAVIAICAAVGAGGLGVATAPDRASADVQSESSAPMRNVSGLAAPVVTPVELAVTPVDAPRASTLRRHPQSRPFTEQFRTWC